MASLRIGSRGSQLALWQANHVAGLLRAQGHSIEIEIIKTTGDKILDVALAKVGTKGMFTKEIEEALSARRVDLAVHSMKDVPTELPAEFDLAAITKREDPRDAFISAKYTSLEELPHRGRVGTSSLRRQCQLKAMRPDLEIIPLRGNVDTRLRKLESGEYDAIILAAAGVHRLGLGKDKDKDKDKHARLLYPIPPDVMCPAVGQGALAIEIRREDHLARSLVQFLDHAETREAVVCERALLGSLGGGCQVPIGAFAEKSRGQLHLRAMVGRPDGTEVLREHASGEDPRELGRATAQALLQRGADRILSDVYSQEVAVPKQP
jgi:hydroxymethylbilane synthase